MIGGNSSAFLSILVLQAQLPNVLEELSYAAWDVVKHRTNISHIMGVASGIIDNTKFKIFKLYSFLFFIFYLQTV